VVTAQHLATQIGVDILKQGGNAVDAAVAVGYALAVVHPCCGNIGGGGFMVVHLASGTNLFLDFRETAPLAATPGMFLDAEGNADPNLSRNSWLASGVPGTVMGFDEALTKYGTMSRASVMDPAIKLAKDGFVLDASDAQILALRTKDFAAQPNVASIFLHSDGQPLAAGERLVQPELAKTLELIAAKGPDGFYKGPIAEAIVAASQANGGLFTLKDFADYTALWTEPVSCTYHEVQVISSPPPSSGGTTVCEILQILQPYPLAQWGYASTKASHAIVEAERRAFADRNTYLGDPAFVKNPVAQLLSAEHADKLRASIKPPRPQRSPAVWALPRVCTPRIIPSSMLPEMRSPSPTRSISISGMRRLPVTPVSFSTTRWTTSPPNRECPTHLGSCRGRSMLSLRTSVRSARWRRPLC
jgi:gamma-glutamyltranspeptidase/glutathione hydrolase